MPLDAELEPHVEEAARLNNVDPNLLRALFDVESGGQTFRKDGSVVTSEKGAGGIGQFIPSTAKAYGVDVRDPVTGIYGTARLLNDNLNVAEQKRAAGRDDIVPVDYALKMYHGGDEESGQWGPKTNAYPGKIAASYQRLVGNQQTAPSGVDKLASLTAQPKEPEQAPDGVAALASVRAPGPATLPFGTNPGVKVQVGLGDDAPVVQPPAAANPQMAQAAPAGGPSDDEILKMLRQVYPSGGKAPSPGAAPPPAGAPATGGAQPALGPQQIIDMLNTAGKAKGGLAAVPGLISGLETMVKEGTQVVRNPDGSYGLGIIPGAEPSKRGIAEAGQAGKDMMRPDQGGNYQLAPGVAAATEEREAAKAKGAGTDLVSSLAKHNLRPALMPDGTIGIEPMPGAPQAAETMSGAEQRGKTRNTITEVRPGAQPRTGAEIMDAAEGKGAPAGATGQPVPGTTALYNNPGTGKGEDIAAEEFGKHKEGFISNQGSAQNLQNFLDAAAAVGTGKGTEFNANTAAWLKSLNIDPQKLSLADPAEVEKMRKASTQMIFQQIRNVSSRPAYQEFQMLSQGNPNPDLQPEANRAIAASLLGRMQWENSLYKAWDADRRKSGSYGNFDFPAWAEANPMPASQASAYLQVPQIPDRSIAGKSDAAPQQFKDGQTITNPQTGEKRVYRGGQWVPVQ